MLTDKDLLSLHILRDSLNNAEQKELLDKLLFEYELYRKCGTPEDCKQREEWIQMSIEDIRKEFNSIVKELRDEVRLIKEQASKPKHKKKFEASNSWDNPPRFNSLEERDLYYK